jgi:hypothetical protein
MILDYECEDSYSIEEIDAIIDSGESAADYIRAQITDTTLRNPSCSGQVGVSQD